MFFDVVTYDSSVNYDRNSSLFVFWWMNANDAFPAQLKDDGYRVAIDRLWEYPERRKDFYWIEHLDWFRLNESLWWRALGYHTYFPVKNPTQKIAFIPIRRANAERDYLFEKLQDQLDDIVCSYRGNLLPGDGDPEHGEWQRFTNPAWYDDCYCSVVAETNISSNRVWPTEKTFKPMAFYHPFQILSAPGHLVYLRQLGFETFDHLFDESYDTLDDYRSRCDVIVDNLSRIKTRQYDLKTQEKLQHNHQLFYDRDKIENIITEEIVNPLLEYVNSQ
jgi:hypothetical protein